MHRSTGLQRLLSVSQLQAVTSLCLLRRTPHRAVSAITLTRASLCATSVWLGTTVAVTRHPILLFSPEAVLGVKLPIRLAFASTARIVHLACRALLTSCEMLARLGTTAPLARRRRCPVLQGRTTPPLESMRSQTASLPQQGTTQLQHLRYLSASALRATTVLLAQRVRRLFRAQPGTTDLNTERPLSRIALCAWAEATVRARQFFLVVFCSALSCGIFNILNV